MPLLRNLGLFLRSVVRHGTLLLTSSLLSVALAFWEHREERSVHMPIYATIVALAFLYATFAAWQDEARRADKAEGSLAQMRSADAGLVKRHMTEPQFWLLSLVQEHGARREMFTSAIEGTRSTVFLWNSPISKSKTRWFYDLVDDAVKSGLLALTEGGVVKTYSVPVEVETSLAAHRRLGRSIEVPKETLYDVRTGQPVEFSI